MPQGGVDLTLAVGANTYDLMVARDQNGVAAFKRFPAPPLNPIINQTGILDYASRNTSEGIVFSVDGFAKGMGFNTYEPGSYAMAENVDCRFGMAFPGPKEVADLTGIAAGFRVVKRVLHAGVNWLCCTDGTDTKIYRVVAGAWSLSTTIVTSVCTDMVSFRGTDTTSAATVGVIAVAFGASVAYQYSIDNGATWVASTKASNGKYANYFATFQYGTATPRVWYVRNPGDLYATTDLTNGGTSSGPTTIGDTGNDNFTSITLDDTGVLLIGKRQYLFTLDGGNIVRVVAGPFRYVATSEAGGNAGLTNFYNPVNIEGRLYYPVEDTRILEYNHGKITLDMQPSTYAPQMIWPTLPLNAMVAVGNWLCVALGATSADTIRTVSNAPGGGALVQNNIRNGRSALFFGRYDPVTGKWLWHGFLLLCTNLLQYMWYDDAAFYLYMASSTTTLVNLQQTRALVTPFNPIYFKSGSTALVTATNCYLDLGIYYQQQPNVNKTSRRVTLKTKGLTANDGSGGASVIDVRYRIVNDYDTSTGYTVLTSYTSDADAVAGTSFPASVTYTGVRYEIGFQTTSAANICILFNAQFQHLFYPPVMDMFQFTIKATNGQMNLTGAAGAMSWKAVRDAIDAMKDATTSATLTDVETGESWSVRMEPNGGMEENGLGDQRSITVTLHEVQ